MKAWPAALLATGLAAWATLAAAAQAWPFDTTQSQAQFSVRKLLFAHVRGTFPGLVGTLRTVAGPGNRVEVDAVMDVAALQMADRREKAQALGPKFFDAARYPRARFVSDPFPFAMLASGGALRGVLVLHGTRRPVTLDLQPSQCPGQPLACPISVKGTISRAQFGMHAWRGALSDKVDVRLEIVVEAPPRIPGS